MKLSNLFSTLRLIFKSKVQAEDVFLALMVMLGVVAVVGGTVMLAITLWYMPSLVMYTLLFVLVWALVAKVVSYYKSKYPN